MRKWSCSYVILCPVCLWYPRDEYLTVEEDLQPGHWSFANGSTRHPSFWFLKHTMPGSISAMTVPCVPHSHWSHQITAHLWAARFLSCHFPRSVLHLQSLRKHGETWGTGDRATCTSLQLSLLQVASLRHSGILSKLHSALITAVHGSLGPSVPSIYPRQSPHEESSRSCSALPNPVIASPRLLTGDAGVEREGFMQLRNRPAMTQICPSSELLVNPDQGHSHSKTMIKKRTLWSCANAPAASSRGWSLPNLVTCVYVRLFSPENSKLKKLFEFFVTSLRWLLYDTEGSCDKQHKYKDNSDLAALHSRGIHSSCTAKRASSMFPSLL